nr:ribosome small subunit-dependent GTPase A [uncultured Kingella sp.]
MLEHAQITAAYGRRYTVRTDAGTSYEASTRSKRTDFACGDFVEILILNGEQAVIENLLPRQSLLYRQDAWKSKLIAANATQLFIVTAAVPSPSEALLQRALIAAEAAVIRPVILLNKTDLPETAALAETLAFYETLGYPVITQSALAGVSGSLKDMMRGETNILLGQSGMGKSTLTNALLGEEAARTQSHSAALDSGRHTTTHTRLYHLDGGGKLIDSPGLQEFGLHHLDASELLGCFPDLRHLAGQCRFHNCTHRAEPGCAVKAAADAGEIRPARLEFLQRLTDERLRR